MKPSSGIEVEAMQRLLHLGPDAHGVLTRWELEQGMNLEARATAKRVLHGDPARADIAGRTDLQRRAVGSRPAAGPCEAREETEIPIAQVGSSVRHSALALEDPIGIEEAIGVDEIIRSGFAMDFGQHRQLKVVVVEAVEQLETDPDTARRSSWRIGSAPGRA